MKICLFCQHFRYDPGEDDWSEMTPGSDAEMFCMKSHWGEYGEIPYNLEECMLTAVDCVDWEPNDFAMSRGLFQPVHIDE